MSTPTPVAQCASFLSQLPRWFAPSADAFADWADDEVLLVLQAHDRDVIFLSQLPDAEGVRLLRCLAPVPIKGLGDRLWTSNEEGDTGWNWLRDEWALNQSSVMFHPPTGALAWVRDLEATAPLAIEKEWPAELEAWIAEGDSLIESLGWSAEVAEPAQATE